MVHNVYAKLPQSVRDEVDTAFAHARRVLVAAGLDCKNDDRAERVVEALAVFVAESNPGVLEGR